MFLPEQIATARLVKGVWRVDFDIDNVHRWVRVLALKGGPPRSTVEIQIDGITSVTDPIAEGSRNSARYDHGEKYLAAGQQLSLVWNLGTGIAPIAVMLCELVETIP